MQKSSAYVVRIYLLYLADRNIDWRIFLSVERNFDKCPRIASLSVKHVRTGLCQSGV